MEQIKFTITTDEVKEIAKDNHAKNLSDEQVKSVLEMVECDEMLWKDISNSIASAIYEVLP